MTASKAARISPKDWLEAGLPLAAAVILAGVCVRSMPMGQAAGSAVTLALLLLTGCPTVRLLLRLARVQYAARQNTDLFHALLRHTPEPTLLHDEEGTLVYANEAYAALVGRPLWELTGVRTYDFWPSPPGSVQRQHDLAVLSGTSARELTETLTLPGGETRHYRTLKFPFEDQMGRRFVGCIWRDVSEQLRLEQTERLAQVAVDSLPDVIFWFDSQGRMMGVNDAACARLGYGRVEMLQMSVRELDAELGAALALRCGEPAPREHVSFTSAHLGKAGIPIPVKVSLHATQLGDQVVWCCWSREIAKCEPAHDGYMRQPGNDELTGLPSWRLFATELGALMAVAPEQPAGLAVLCIGLSGLKLINNTLGHECGDVLLQQAAARLAQFAPAPGMLARIDCKEFAVLLARPDAESAAPVLARRILHALQESFPVEGHELQVAPSIGISLFPRDGRDANSLLRNAAAAMYAARCQGKHEVRFFAPEIHVKARAKLGLETALRHAVERRELLLYFQPQVSLETNQVVRYESLLRWNHPVLGMMPPDKFLAVAEETGLIIPIGRWVLQEACRQIRKVQLFTGRPVGVAVNISTPEFLRADFYDAVVASLRETGLPAALLDLELTESVVLQDTAEVADKIQKLRALGVTFSIDDFGTGYSALSYLQWLRVHSLKIDRSFLRQVPADSQATSMLRTLVTMAHDLGMKVVIEGVEQPYQLETARELGGDLVQGYYIGRPAPLGGDLDTAVSLHHLDHALTSEAEVAITSQGTALNGCRESG